MEYLLGLLAIILGYGILKILSFIVIVCLIIWVIFSFSALVDNNENTKKSKLQTAEDAEDIGGKALDLFGKIFFYGLGIIIIIIVIVILNYI